MHQEEEKIDTKILTASSWFRNFHANPDSIILKFNDNVSEINNAKISLITFRSYDFQDLKLENGDGNFIRNSQNVLLPPFISQGDFLNADSENLTFANNGAIFLPFIELSNSEVFIPAETLNPNDKQKIYTDNHNFFSPQTINKISFVKNNNFLSTFNQSAQKTFVQKDELSQKMPEFSRTIHQKLSKLQTSSKNELELMKKVAEELEFYSQKSLSDIKDERGFSSSGDLTAKRIETQFANFKSSTPNCLNREISAPCAMIIGDELQFSLILSLVSSQIGLPSQIRIIANSDEFGTVHFKSVKCSFEVFFDNKWNEIEFNLRENNQMPSLNDNKTYLFKTATIDKTEIESNSPQNSNKENENGETHEKTASFFANILSFLLYYFKYFQGVIIVLFLLLLIFFFKKTIRKNSIKNLNPSLIKKQLILDFIDKYYILKMQNMIMNINNRNAMQKNIANIKLIFSKSATFVEMMNEIEKLIKLDDFEHFTRILNQQKYSKDGVNLKNHKAFLAVFANDISSKNAFNNKFSQMLFTISPISLFYICLVAINKLQCVIITKLWQKLKRNLNQLLNEKNRRAKTFVQLLIRQSQKRKSEQKI